MRDRVVEDLPLAREGRVDEDQAGDRLHDPVVEHVDPARAGHPVQLRVEDEQRHHAEPEDRHGIADEPEHPDHVIRPSALAHRRQHPHGDPQEHPQHRRDGGQLHGRREEPDQVVEHRPGGHDRRAQIAPRELPEIAPVLLVQRPVQAHLPVDAVVDVLRGAVADHREHRIGGHDPADDEGHRGQADEREQQGEAHPAEESRRRPSPGGGVGSEHQCMGSIDPSGPSGRIACRSAGADRESRPTWPRSGRTPGRSSSRRRTPGRACAAPPAPSAGT